MARPSVSDFGAVGDGSETSIAANDAAFAAAAAAGAGNGGFTVPGGRFMISQGAVSDYSRCMISGDHRFSTEVIITNQTDAFIFDYSERDLHFCGVEKIQFSYSGSAKPVNGSGVRLRTTQANPQYGMTNLEFKDLTARYVKHAILADKPAMVDWQGIQQIANYGHITVDNLNIPYNSGWTEYGVKFKGGPGAHNNFRGGNMSTAIAGIAMGDGSQDCGVGDQVFHGLQIIDGQHGILIEGPSGAGRYNENIVIANCQFDGTTVSTVKMRRMKNFRIRNINSTSAATYDLDTCTDYSVEESGVNCSEYTIREFTTSSGTRTIPLFEVEFNPATLETYRCVDAEIFIDTLVGGVGNRPVKWRGVFAYTSGTACSVHEENVRTLGTGAELLFSTASGKVKCSLKISNALQNCKVGGNFRLAGRNYSVTKL